ncbi:MAG: DNA-binding beta-propeller fold protein YncE [Rubritalea sp.]|jgi:DNA-binding beta-propeller fold protein YncE
MKLLNAKLTSLFALCALIHPLSAHDDAAGAKHEHKEVIKSPTMTGNGQYTYIADAQWGSLKDGKILGPTHGSVVVDSKGLIYVSTDGPDSLFVFDAAGKLVKTMAAEARGMHHMAIVKEGDKEFIYGAQLQNNKRIVKLDLDGKVVMEITPETAEVQGGYNGITGVAVAADGSIFASMGYGSNLIHKFDKAGKHLKTFGGRGKEMEKFRTPHTITVDTRFDEPRLLVCDREKRRLVHFDLEGKFLSVYATNLRRPCAVSIHGDVCAVAELESRVTIIDKNGAPISFLGDNPNKKHWANFKVPATDQKVGIFSAPHGLSFDKDGNLYVQDWNITGRATQLKLVK